ncbi:MAG TPA: phosphatidate cytidylyltransferase [Terracidiphilus sp.]|nr:phosphatidate cytidylyltransferase [Terracidiphilus sp.]
MKRVYTALILIPLVLVLVFLGPWWQWLFTLAVAGVAALAAWEFMGLAEKAGATPPRIAVLVAVLILFACNLKWPIQNPAMFGIFGILSLGLLVYCTFFSPVEQIMADASSSIFCLFYIGFTLLVLPALRDNPEGNGPSLVAFLLCAVWAGDTAALYVGRAWGRHKMAPTLSPGKTWEGAIGSMGGSLLSTGILLGLAQLMQMPMWNVSWRLSYSGGAWWYWLGLTVVVNVAAQVGDLAESALKRSAGVKDSGSLLPGHGGVLDRIDALLIAAPVLWYAQIIHQWF